MPNLRSSGILKKAVDQSRKVSQAAMSSSSQFELKSGQYSRKGERQLVNQHVVSH